MNQNGSLLKGSEWAFASLLSSAEGAEFFCHKMHLFVKVQGLILSFPALDEILSSGCNNKRPFGSIWKEQTNKNKTRKKENKQNLPQEYVDKGSCIEANST